LNDIYIATKQQIKLVFRLIFEIKQPTTLKNLKIRNAYILGIIVLFSMFIMQSCTKHISCPAYGKVNKSFEKTQSDQV